MDNLLDLLTENNTNHIEDFDNDAIHRGITVPQEASEVNTHFFSHK